MENTEKRKINIQIVCVFVFARYEICMVYVSEQEEEWEKYVIRQKMNVDCFTFVESIDFSVHFEMGTEIEWHKRREMEMEMHQN